MFSFYSPKHNAGRPTEGSRLTGTESPGTSTPAPPAASRGGQPSGNLDQGALSIRQPVSPAKGLWWEHNFYISFHHPAAARARLPKINKKPRLSRALPPHVNRQPRRATALLLQNQGSREKNVQLNHTEGSRGEGRAPERGGDERKRGEGGATPLRSSTPAPTVLT